MAGNTFNLGSDLAIGAQMGATLNQARQSQQNALMPEMGGIVGGGGGVMIGGMTPQEYKARRTVIEDQREDEKYEYEKSQRPWHEAETEADIARVRAETDKIKKETEVAASEAVGKMNDNERRAALDEAMILHGGLRAAAAKGEAAWNEILFSHGDYIREELGFDWQQLGYDNANVILAKLEGAINSIVLASELDGNKMIDFSGQNDPLSPQGRFYADQRAGLIPEDEQYKGGGPTINMPGSGPGLGKLSTDYAYVIDPATNEPKIDSATGLPIAAPVPGSPAAQEIQGGAQAADAKLAQEKQQAGIVLQNVSDLKETLTKESQGGRSLFDLPETGRVGNALSRMGVNQEAIDVGQKLATLQSAIAFDRLQKMRDASPTGGALGAVSAPELLLLQNSVGALSQITSKDELLKTLDVIEGIMKKFEAYPNSTEDPPATDFPYLENGLPDFPAMTDEQLDEFISRGGGQ